MHADHDPVEGKRKIVQSVTVSDQDINSICMVPLIVLNLLFECFCFFYILRITICFRNSDAMNSNAAGS